MNSLLRKLGWLLRRNRKEQDLEAELQFHLDEEAEERRQEGLPEADARLAARRDLGNIAIVQENTREVWGWILLEQLSQDLRYALRTMRANPLFTVLAILSVGLGIGASTSVYSFVDAVLLRSLPVEHPESLVVIDWKMKIPEKGGSDTVMNGMDGNTYHDPDIGWTGGIFPYPAFEVLRKIDSAFSSVFAFHPAGNLNVSIDARAEIAEGVYVSGDYFRGLGVGSAAGRMLTRDDDEPAVARVAVLSYGLSERRFGDPARAVGQPIVINNVPFTVVGVAARDFSGVDPARAPQVYLPLHAEVLLAGNNMDVSARMYLEQNYYWLQMMARLNPGISHAQAQATAGVPFRQWVETTAHTDLERSNLPELFLNDGSGGTDAMRRQYAKPLYFLLLLVILILAIACANIANLLLARAATRRREIALRVTVGAGRLRILRQLLTESVMLATIGGALGVVFAFWGIRFLTVLLDNGRTAAPPSAELNLNVLAVATALSVLTGLVFGMAPAVLASRSNVIPALKQLRFANPPTWIRVGTRDLLVISQITMSLFMLVAAGLFVRTLSKLQSIDIGFNRENLLLFQVNARQSGHTGVEMATFYEDLRQRITEISGIRNASLSNRAFFTAGFSLPITVAGKRVDTMLLFVGPDFFSTLQIPMAAGREIESSDRPGSPMTAVVSEMFARQFSATEDPIGRQIELRDAQQVRQMQIVGVARDARYGGLKRNLRPVVYVPYNQGAFAFIDQMTYEVRTDGDPLGYVNTIRDIVHQMDAGLPVANIITQSGQIDRTISQEIMFGRLSTTIAFVGLSIACVGLYGAIAYNVARRTSEIGIRMALGARRGRVMMMVLRKVIVCTVAAFALGLPLCLLASRQMESFLFGITPRDPLTVAIAVAILLISAALSAFVPARRAARIDPVLALRHE